MSAFPLKGGLVLLLDDADDHFVMGRFISLQSAGYAKVCGLYVHRLVMAAATGEMVDHINGNRLDCRRGNLRKATRSQNLFNRGKASHNTTGFKGVSLCKETGRFRAEIRHEGRRLKLGRHVTPEAAARAYDSAAVRLHGEFARLNFSDGAVGKGCDA